MEMSILDYLRNKECDGYNIVRKGEIVGSINTSFVMGKLEVFGFVHFENSNEVDIITLKDGELIAGLKVDCFNVKTKNRIGYDLEQLAEAIGEWYFNEGGRDMLIAEIVDEEDIKRTVKDFIEEYRNSKELQALGDKIENLADEYLKELFNVKRK